uniref:SHSP domain-containing protein n=1 Tax=Trichobilharzia regenti TaxID=157069 RepID=A0AA85JMZ4_TRIRE|nr:unnamed protein product [Trichobilharzia regenti]
MIEQRTSFGIIFSSGSTIVYICLYTYIWPLDDFGMNDWDTHEPNSLIRQMEQRMQEMRKRMGISDMPPFKATFDDFLNDPYEIGNDGKLHFKVRFDVKGFSPEDINVKTTDNGVVVSAKKVTQTNTSKSSREFCRMIELPQSIEQTKLECHLTDDGVLLLEAPVKNNDHKSVTFNNKPQLAIRPKSAFSRPTTPRNGRKSPAKPLILKGTPGPTIIDDGYKGKRLHVEIPIDPMYKSEDLCINVEPNNRLVVSGKHTKHTGEGVRLRRTSSPSAQFTHSYEIPQAVDPSSITSEIVGNTLIIEAPLNKSYSSYY